MLTWLSNNIGTIAVFAVLAAIVVFIILHMRKDRRAGKSTCGANCAHCAMHGTCHSAQKR